MAVEPDTLLAGPRGRRLLLECARGMASEQGGDLGWDFVSALHLLEYDLDPAKGSTSLVTLGLAGDPPTPPPKPSVKDCARLLEELPLVSLGARELAISLRAAVDNARYWQPPDGGDVLGALPQMRPGLRRVAEHIARSAFVTSFQRVLDSSEQWSVLPADEDRKLPASVNVELTRWRTAAIEEEQRAARELPADPRGPFSGTWWCTPPRSLVRSTGAWRDLGPVGLWLIEDNFGWSDMTASRVSASPGRVFEIDGPAAWVELSARFPLEVTASRRHDWYRATGGTGRWLIPDWSRVADDFDAVHLTVQGYLTAAGRELTVGGEYATVLAGWDPDATYWLLDEVDVTVQQAWHRDDLDWRATPVERD